ncbi:hypothetical protein [Pseudoruegeria sp. SHC-113]|uniref:hypothetical protein n=1 Tax=Pseudoruegeria sp. SHC-113 TaxID=2855439 RepID=UPI0021BAB399|nr:hypothetical protein [Pseudoruegeria sp. SHC-113]MCT8160072.1 hypothetical protein [Pseudoruegeria sp. SHC-113]
MKLKGLIFAALLTLPTAAAAAGCGGGHSMGASSCPPGQIWDGDSQQCISGASS